MVNLNSDGPIWNLKVQWNQCGDRKLRLRWAALILDLILSDAISPGKRLSKDYPKIMGGDLTTAENLIISACIGESDRV